MAVLFGYHRACEDHKTGLAHPESPNRLKAALHGIDQAGLDEALIRFSPRAATKDELARVHSRELIDFVEEIANNGGGQLDPDTVVSPGSYEAALRAAGAGLESIERLERGEADAAFLAMRPPGHHARANRSMGFCLFNSVAVTAASLVARGERVLIVDWDAHHGNGTEEAFYSSSDVLFVSLHQYPFYPGTGAVGDIGVDEGLGYTINLPFPAHTAGDAYRLAFDTVIIPAVEEFSPSWLLVSAGFDAHRRDPLTQLGLSSADFADLTTRTCQLVAPGRRIVFLEGGYDEQGVADSVGASVAALAGERYRPEVETSGGTLGGLSEVIQHARELHERAGGQ